MNLRTLLEIVALLGTAGSLSFYLVAAFSLLDFLKHNRKTLNGSFLPPVSILKPLKGVDPEIWQSFCSHAEQDYPEFEIIFGVSNSADPACEIVRELQATYPERRIKLVVADRILGTNVKVSTLAQMVPQAAHGILLVNDSDIRVGRDYLKRVVPPLADPQVGLVTCLYRAEPASTLGSRLEALGIATDFVPGVLSARFLEKGLHFGLGSTLAFRRSDLASIGGFESILDYLADDYELGRRIASTGKRVELGPATVTTFLPPYSLAEFWQHQLRWSRTIRDARRGGYLGLLFTFGLPWSLLMVSASGGALWAWFLAALTYGVRLGLASATASQVIGDRYTASNIFLLPLRDLLAPFVWLVGLFGNTIHWRGDDFYLKDGRLSKRNRVLQ
ncbi:MAG TPA: bacteriohopanetetrol glucosamine biosynthesis glycosyltransferase HpnI [Terriglobales bacterium]|nr:bacteriohopanetetrol glucosamine biosynthesis glycosyltransferase HpnI [Terriglobales bacterium]